MKEVIQESYLNSALPLPNVHLDPSPKSPMKVRTSTQRSSRQVERVEPVFVMHRPQLGLVLDSHFIDIFDCRNASEWHSRNIISLYP